MSENLPRILDASGRPMPNARERHSMEVARTNYRAGLSGPNWNPYDAADMWDQRMAEWQPMLLSPDAEINFNRNRMVSRLRDAVRNDGWDRRCYAHLG